MRFLGILTAVMLLSFMISGCDFGTRITGGTITITAPVAGATPATQAEVTGPSGTTVTGVTWSVFSPATGAWTAHPAATNFSNGGTYRATINLTASDGFDLASSEAFSVAGAVSVTNQTGRHDNVSVIVAFPPAMLPVITAVTINAVPHTGNINAVFNTRNQIVASASPARDISIAANVTVANWYEHTHHDFVGAFPNPPTFQLGRFYRATITLRASPNHTFPDNFAATAITVTGGVTNAVTGLTVDNGGENANSITFTATWSQTVTATFEGTPSGGALPDAPAGGFIDITLNNGEGGSSNVLVTNPIPAAHSSATHWFTPGLPGNATATATRYADAIIRITFAGQVAEAGTVTFTQIAVPPEVTSHTGPIHATGNVPFTTAGGSPTATFAGVPGNLPDGGCSVAPTPASGFIDVTLTNATVLDTFPTETPATDWFTPPLPAGARARASRLNAGVIRITFDQQVTNYGTVTFTHIAVPPEATSHTVAINATGNVAFVTGVVPLDPPTKITLTPAGVISFTPGANNAAGLVAGFEFTLYQGNDPASIPQFTNQGIVSGVTFPGLMNTMLLESAAYTVKVQAISANPKFANSNPATSSVVNVLSVTLTLSGGNSTDSVEFITAPPGPINIVGDTGVHHDNNTYTIRVFGGATVIVRATPEGTRRVVFSGPAGTGIGLGGQGPGTFTRTITGITGNAAITATFSEN